MVATLTRARRKSNEVADLFAKKGIGQVLIFAEIQKFCITLF